MSPYDELLAQPQFCLPQGKKERLLLEGLLQLTEHHRRHCPPYDRMVSAAGGPDPIERLADLPYVPVGLFKSHLLSSVAGDEVFKTLTSSGTTGQAPSRIVLDRATADRQTRSLAAIMATALGPKRLPMLIVDTPSVLRDRTSFSARGAGILGMMNFGRAHRYLLDDDMRLDRAGLHEFLTAFAGQPVLIFGFTFMVWKHLYQPLVDSGVDLSQAVLVHSGGWKSLEAESVDNTAFKESLQRSLGIRRIHNFYGMVEQVGSVFLEAPDGLLRPPNFAEVIIRDPVTWEEAPDGTPGVIQVLSVLPYSYPGHSLLTEDLGVVVGIAGPEEGWGGKRLRVLGRVPRSELRGCSDTHAAEWVAGGA